MEIERKYLVKTIPENIDSYPHKEYSQAYLNTDPVIRIRKEGDEYVLTYKGKGMITREEYNLPINKDSFNHLLPKCDGFIINKTRYFIDLDDDGLTAEFDIYKDYLRGFITVEVEFETQTACNNFIPPAWFGLEVSKDLRYHNSSLSLGDIDINTIK